jgi:hypothetical protein
LDLDHAGPEANLTNDDVDVRGVRR